MRAVNLIPDGGASRWKGPGLPADGRIGAYVVVAMLGIALAVGAAGALANRQLGESRADLGHVQREASAAEERASSLQRYSDVAALSKARIDTVAGLLHGRFNWARSLRDIARAMPSDVPLISLVGTVSPSSPVAGGGGGSSMRAALPVPAVDLIGCAKSQTRVAQLIGRLRRMHGVQRVSLASAEKSESGSANATDCRATDAMPQFQLTVFYEGLDGIVPLSESGAAAPAEGSPAAPSTPPPAGAASADAEAVAR